MCGVVGACLLAVSDKRVFGQKKGPSRSAQSERQRQPWFSHTSQQHSTILGNTIAKSASGARDMGRQKGVHRDSIAN
jgi:hypothetical protein